MTVTTDVQPYRIGIADPRMYTWGIDAASGQAESAMPSNTTFQ
ncbi:hypothetical protein [Stutzerimonas kunmingensis]|nr:hypothetical protein [Stutzerimonas kunmingensis]